MAEKSRDPWVDIKTRHGFQGDEVISALQKEIRRGNTENAALLAYEMATTSPEMRHISGAACWSYRWRTSDLGITLRLS